MVTSGYVNIVDARTRRSLVYPLQGDPFNLGQIELAILKAIWLCGGEPPAIAYMQPAIYSLFRSATRSISRYSAGVSNRIRSAAIFLIPRWMQRSQSPSK